jgi:ribosomal protein S17E
VRRVAAFKQRLGEGKQTARGDKIRNRLSGLLAHKYVKTAQKEAARQDLG